MKRFQLLKRRGKPLLYLPLELVAAFRGLELYPAQTKKGRLYKAGVRSLLKLRIPVGRIVSHTPFPICPELERLFCELAGCDNPAIAILVGNPACESHRFICSVIDEKAEVKAVVKVGMTHAARHLIRREYGLLSSAPAFTPGITRARNILETEHLSAIVLDYAFGNPPKHVTWRQLFSFLRGWINNDAPKPILDFPQMLELKAHAEPTLFRSLENALTNCMAKSVLCNGDFAKWNIREDPFGQWTVLDWEKGELQAVPTWTWFHLLLQNQILVRKSAPPDVVATVETFLKEPYFRSYCAICGVAGLERELLLSYLLHVVNVFKPTEGMESYKQLLAILKTRWMRPPVTASLSQEEPATTTPDISIVTPSYNQPQWLKLCTASVASQLGVAVEHIVQDAGTPGLELPAQAHQQYELRIFQEKDSGMYDAINRGFLKARGEIVAWLNCDEQYLPGTLRTVVDYFRDHPEVDVLFGDAVLVDESGEVLSYRRTLMPKLLHTQLAHLGALSCAMFFRRSLIQRFPLDTQWKTIADAVLVVSLLKSKCRMAVLNQPLAAFAMTQANLGQSSFLMAEMQRWRSELPAPIRALTPLVILHHRLRKLLAGAYRKYSIHTTLFRSPQLSQEIAAHNVGFAWPQIGDGKPATKRGTYEAGFESEKAVKSPLRRLLFAAVGLTIVTAVFILDLGANTLAVTPFFCAITLLALAFVLRPLEIAGTSLLMSVLLSLSLIYLQQFRNGDPHIEWIRVLLRLGSFAAATVLAMLFSRYRLYSARMTDQTFEVLSRMPAPVIVSDAYGQIRFANNAAIQLLSKDSRNLRGVSYTRLLLTESEEGSADRIYRKVFEESASKHRSITLSHGAGMQLSAHTASIGERENRLMVTLVAP